MEGLRSHLWNDRLRSLVALIAMLGVLQRDVNHVPCGGSVGRVKPVWLRVNA